MITRREFIEAHQNASSHQEVADVTGLTIGTCRSRASQLRSQGIPMKSFARQSKVSLEADIAFAKSLLDPTTEGEDTPEEGEGNPVVDSVVVETTTEEEKVETPTNG